MSHQPFAHLHCHSHYSLLDGASAIPDLVERASELGMTALALTDHGNLHGALDFYRHAQRVGINPVLGYEAYIAPGSRHQKEGSAKESAYHLTLLAKNRTGFRNLLKLASKAYLEGFYRRPRIDRDLLSEHHEGIICLSGCVSSEFSRALLRGQSGSPELAEAKEIAAWFHRLFGDRYFIEIQNNGLEIQRAQRFGAVQVAQEMGLPLVATSDAHYVRREDAEAQDVLLCINTGRYRTDTNRMKMEGDQFFLRSPEEMYAALPDQQEALARSQEIADSVEIDLELGKRYFPTYTPPDNKSSAEFLRELCIRGLKERYRDWPQRWSGDDLSSEVLDRLDRELTVINDLGFSNYFLIVWDFVEYARRKEIPATARGSGVGALVCYALYLSHVCPLEYDLLFERFLDRNRLEAPDIDIDFCKERRGDVIQYVKDVYGDQNVAQIGTFGTLAARAAIRDVGRALGMPIYRVDQVVAMVPEQLGIKLRDALTNSEELKTTYDSDGEVRELIDLAMKIEGLARNVGTHAAAVVIADEPLENYVPLCRVTGKTEVITQWSMNDVEAAGLLKMDFLGLRNLTILSKAIELIEQSTGQQIDPLKFPLDDQPTYDLLCRGEAKGVFQLESGGIRDLLQRMKPDCFNDIIATNALYRPGPLEGGMVDDYIEVKHGRKPASHPHPVMEEVLAETHGVMVYQEQVMRILNRLGGIELSNAYSCIKAISKKKLPMIAKFKEEFLAGATSQGLDASKADELFSMIEKFAGYGFNKSHSTAYALIAYQTAYLKTHYPAEYMAALLTGDIPGRNFKKKDSLVDHLEECQRMQLEVIPPNVNRSHATFAVENGEILFGLSAIKSCGGSAAEAIVACRTSDGPFRDLFDFCERVDQQACGRTTIESLIRAGAFDSCGGRREQWLAVLDRAVQAGANSQKDRKSGQKSLFESFDSDEPQDDPSRSLPDVASLSEKDTLAAEKEVLGFYLSSHPLAEHEALLAKYCTHSTSALSGLAHRAEVMLGGMLASLKFSHTKAPRAGSTHTKYAMFDLEDVSGLVRCIVWPEQFAKYGTVVQADAILVVRGKVDRRPGSEETNLIVDELIQLSDLEGKYSSGVMIRVQEDHHGQRGLEQLYEILRCYPGEKSLQIKLWLADGTKLGLQPRRMRVDLNAEMRRRVEDLLGPGNFRVLIHTPA